jgi:shikimate kinase
MNNESTRGRDGADMGARDGGCYCIGVIVDPQIESRSEGIFRPLRILLSELWIAVVVRDRIGVVVGDTSVDSMNVRFPFVGREKEIERLRQLHTQRKHVLILGPAGVGKSMLVAHLGQTLDLRVCPASERLSEICEALEREFGLDAGDLHLVRRKNRLLKTLKGTKRPVVFDGASWTTPKLSSFIESVSERVPVWLCARSEHPWDIGRIWPVLVRFEHVELNPFHPSETLLLVGVAMRGGSVPADTLNIVEWLHRHAAGSPKILCELLEEIARGHYDLSNSHALRRLDLDRRIHEIFPTAPVNKKPENRHD